MKNQKVICIRFSLMPSRKNKSKYKTITTNNLRSSNKTMLTSIQITLELTYSYIKASNFKLLNVLFESQYCYKKTYFLKLKGVRYIVNDAYFSVLK